MRRRRIPVAPLSIAIALSASLSGGSALADLPPTPPPPDMVDQRPATPKPTKNPKTTAPADAPTAAPSDAELVPQDMPELTERDKQMLAIKWQPGPIKGTLGDIAEIDVPEGFLFVDGDGTRKFLELNENLTNGKELGMVASKDFNWFVAFEFSDIGYVKDDEKSDLDADAILTSLREGNEAGNQQKKLRGWRTLSLLGWASPPKYDEATQNLEWAPKFQDDIDKTIAVNHFIRVLGRQGVMEISLVTSPEDYATTLPETKKLLAGFSFQAGQKYSEYRQGDKIAAIGLTGLIVGGGVAAAAKSGLLGGLFKFLGKSIKLLVLAGAAAAAGIAKLFGRKKDDA
ncbi:MAG: DUF2167 domain-containing protein [Polyangiaceae bacterium]|nr:DUF2167 domain-containing protein [Polyangiaceae bacterium]